MTATHVFASVIIPTHDRPAALEKTLAALARQSYEHSDWEVIVVAVACKEDTLSLLRSITLPCDFSWIQQDVNNVALARNGGAAAAEGQVIIFLDDDVEPAPSFLDAHIATHRKRAWQVTIGYSQPLLPDGASLLRTTLRASWEDIFLDMRMPGHRYEYRDVLSGNLSISADLFAHVGGFNTTLTCREDYELGVRLISAGCTLAFCAAAHGYHHDTFSLPKICSRKQQEGAADVVMGFLHPSIRSTMPLMQLAHSSGKWGALFRRLALSAPAFTDIIILLLQHLLGFADSLRLRTPWRRVMTFILHYWYWRGAATELGSLRALDSYLQSCPLRADAILGAMEIDFDLRSGLDLAEQTVDSSRPDGIRFWFDTIPVGHITPRAGSEKLRGAHIRPFLTASLARQYVPVAMTEAIDWPYPGRGSENDANQNS